MPTSNGVLLCRNDSDAEYAYLIVLYGNNENNRKSTNLANWTERVLLAVSMINTVGYHYEIKSSKYCDE